jgi:hypothetical protein
VAHTNNLRRSVLPRLKSLKSLTFVRRRLHFSARLSSGEPIEYLRRHQKLFEDLHVEDPKHSVPLVTMDTEPILMGLKKSVEGHKLLIAALRK